MSKLHPTIHQSDLFSNCENYMSKLLRKKIDKPRVDQRVSRDKPTSRTTNQMALSRCPVLKSSNAPLIKVDDIQEHPSANQLVHKEVFNNNMATVEVTVRTLSARKRSRSNSLSLEKREPWGKLLQNRKSDDNIGSFNNFDPLRTIHFLSKELQLKLQTSCPGDPGLQQIVNDIQQAIYRLPPEVLSAQLSQDSLTHSKDYCGDTDFVNAIKKDISEKVLQATQKPPKVCQSVQTILIGDAENKLQQQFENKASKLEETCKQMEESCVKLKTEKENINLQLEAERERIKNLQKQLEEQTVEKEGKSSLAIKQLSEERDELQNQLQRTKSELEAHAGPSTQELRSIVQKLRDDFEKTNDDNRKVKNEMTLMQLERDKMSVLLDSRDKQLQELRCELDGIQNMVCSQLIELKASPSFSQSSSMSTIASKIWKPSQHSRLKEKGSQGKSVHELYLKKMRSQYYNLASIDSLSSTMMHDTDLTKKPTCMNLKSNMDLQDELPQRDIPMSKMDLNRMHESKHAPSNITIASTTADFIKDDPESNIKEMFAELKRQAFLNVDVTLPSPPKPFKDTSSLASESRNSFNSQS